MRQKLIALFTLVVMVSIGQVALAQGMRNSAAPPTGAVTDNTRAIAEKPIFYVKIRGITDSLEPRADLGIPSAPPKSEAGTVDGFRISIGITDEAGAGS